jgi:hypothetical protein
VSVSTVEIGARCAACSIGGTVKKRNANRAMWLLVLAGGTPEPACDRHARMGCRRDGAFAVALHLPMMTAETLALEGGGTSPAEPFSRGDDGPRGEVAPCFVAASFSGSYMRREDRAGFCAHDTDSPALRRARRRGAPAISSPAPTPADPNAEDGTAPRW